MELFMRKNVITFGRIKMNWSELSVEQSARPQLIDAATGHFDISNVTLLPEINQSIHKHCHSIELDLGLLLPQDKLNDKYLCNPLKMQFLPITPCQVIPIDLKPFSKLNQTKQIEKKKHCSKFA